MVPQTNLRKYVMVVEVVPNRNIVTDVDCKLVRSIYRVIQTLEGMIPPASILQGFTSSGIKLYQLPSDLPLKRREVLIKLKSREEKYLWDLRTVKVCSRHNYRLDSFLMHVLNYIRKE